MLHLLLACRSMEASDHHDDSSHSSSISESEREDSRASEAETVPERKKALSLDDYKRRKALIALLEHGDELMRFCQTLGLSAADEVEAAKSLVDRGLQQVALDHFSALKHRGTRGSAPFFDTDPVVLRVLLFSAFT